jgi:hypothetical protein
VAIMLSRLLMVVCGKNWISYCCTGVLPDTLLMLD